MKSFKPHLEVLPPAQRKLWPELSAIPTEFVLYRGTGLALHLGHRDSVDFDFFSNRPIDVATLEAKIPFLKQAKIIQREPNTLSAVVGRDKGVQVSFFGVPSLQRLMPPHVTSDNGLKIASLIDLAGTKASAVQLRAEAKDYIDMDALLRLGKVDLPMALAAAQKIYGPSFNPEITLKALVYFDGGDLSILPEDLKLRLAVAVRDVDLEHLPEIDSSTLRRDLDHEYEL